MICYIEADVFTVTDVTMLDSGTRPLTADTHCRANCACASDDTVVDNGAAVDCDL